MHTHLKIQCIMNHRYVLVRHFYLNFCSTNVSKWKNLLIVTYFFKKCWGIFHSAMKGTKCASLLMIKKKNPSGSGQIYDIKCIFWAYIISMVHIPFKALCFFFMYGHVQQMFDKIFLVKSNNSTLVWFEKKKTITITHPHTQCQ